MATWMIKLRRKGRDDCKSQNVFTIRAEREGRVSEGCLATFYLFLDQGR